MFLRVPVSGVVSPAMFSAEVLWAGGCWDQYSQVTSWEGESSIPLSLGWCPRYFSALEKPHRCWLWALQTQLEKDVGRHRTQSHVKGVVQRQEFSQECPCGFSQAQVAGGHAKSNPLQSGFPQLGCQALKEYGHSAWQMSAVATLSHLPQSKPLILLSLSQFWPSIHLTCWPSFTWPFPPILPKQSWKVSLKCATCELNPSNGSMTKILPMRNNQTTYFLRK